MTKRTIAFLGASITRGNVSADFTRAVGRALDANVVNAGVNGDLAYNARLRLPGLLANKPDDVVVLVGSNDVMATLDARREARYRRSKRLPQTPTRAFYEENLDAIALAVTQAGARLTLCTLPMLGEALDDEVNAKVRAYNDTVRSVAARHGAALVDVTAR